MPFLEHLDRAWRRRVEAPEALAGLIEGADRDALDPASLGAVAVAEATLARRRGDLEGAWRLLVDVEPRLTAPWDVRARALKGALQLERVGPAESVAALRPVIEQLLAEPTTPAIDVAVARNDLGRALLQAGRVAEADGAFARAAEVMLALGLHDARGLVLTNRANARSVLGDLEGALTLYRDALAGSISARTEALVHTNLAVVHERLRDIEGAIEACRRALEGDPEPAVRTTAAALLANLLLDRGETDAARAILERERGQAHGLGPIPLAPLELAESRLDPPQVAEARLAACMAAAAAASAEELRLRACLALARRVLDDGRPSEAVALLEPELESLDPGLGKPVGPLGELLGAALEAAGRPADACAVYRRTFERTGAQIEEETRWRVRELSVLLGVDDLRRRASRERRLLEEQLRHSQRLETAGRLAAAVAHDFNNLLMVVSSCLEIACEEITDPEVSRLLRDAREATDRGAQLSATLLASGHRAHANVEAIDPANAVRAAVDLAAHLSRQVALRVEGHATRRVRADASLASQVLLNLLVNGIDAMPGGGTLTVRLFDAEHLGEPGVRFEVEDTGTGIPEELLERIFEPFFTTKPAEIGTGLGLSTVFGIVRQLGGTVDVRSTPGAGSTFGVWLPEAAPTSKRGRSGGAAAPGLA